MNTQVKRFKREQLKPKQYLTKKECAEMLNISTKTVQRLCSDSKLTFVRLSPKTLRIELNSINRLINEHTVKAVNYRHGF
jgi:excisionase family DNA binding protein